MCYLVYKTQKLCYFVSMISERMIRVVNDALIKKGMEVLAKESALSPGAIHNIASGRHVPRRRNAYRLALACGCSEDEALRLAYECTPESKIA